MVVVNAYNTTYTYDAVGNRLVERQGAARTTSTYDAANQLETAVDGTGTTTYTYDNAGNLSVASAPVVRGQPTAGTTRTGTRG